MNLVTDLSAKEQRIKRVVHEQSKLYWGDIDFSGGSQRDDAANHVMCTQILEECKYRRWGVERFDSVVLQDFLANCLESCVAERDIEKWGFAVKYMGPGRDTYWYSEEADYIIIHMCDASFFAPAQTTTWGDVLLHILAMVDLCNTVDLLHNVVFGAARRVNSQPQKLRVAGA
jgi:hypothetical protein